MHEQDIHILSSPIEYLKGVGPARADLLKKELGIYTFYDLLQHYPLRHIDKTKITPIGQLNPSLDYVQIVAKIMHWDIVGEKRGRRLIAMVKDETGILELVWFQGISWIQKNLLESTHYLIFGKLSYFNGRPQITHPEMEVFHPATLEAKTRLEPVYPSTEKLKARQLNGRQLAKLTEVLLNQIQPNHISENLPETLIQTLQLPSRYEALHWIHFPNQFNDYQRAKNRLKFEELFFAQIRLQRIRLARHATCKGYVFEKVGDLFMNFYNHHLPFQLTGAQKRVVKEIRQDTSRGHQMNRLLQGDVGSGKTMVGVLCMLLAADNGYQSCLMAPTEILAQQHFQGISELLQPMNVPVALLTGSTKKADRKVILEGLANGSIPIVIGTHALIEDPVIFKKLGFAIIDEQHRFGVAQRAALWKKSTLPPHVLVMTATPIPRTLAMTAYGDLDYSIMDELPPGRQPVTTIQRNEMARSRVMEFVRTEIEKGRQAYFVYPLIEESSKLDYEDLERGYQEVISYFPSHKYRTVKIHGKLTQEQKDASMREFVSGQANILVGTTVIEVGVNVPNASVMVIESAEKFGLSQLHQLRGRVGRGAEKSFCILLTGSKMGQESRQRMEIMTSTNDGFVIAEKDLEMRGPGDIEGTRQSGALDFKIASITEDKELLELAGKTAEHVLEEDPDLILAKNLPIKKYLQSQKGKTGWSKIS